MDPVGGVVPFTWACRRAGRCCSAPDGYTWLAEGEVAGLAAALGLEPEAFRRAHVRRVPDPRGAGLADALTERDDGRCSLLEGGNECRVYAARPAHCRSFPYWASVLESAAGFERARATCPGIAVRPPAALEARGFAALDTLRSAFQRELEERHGVAFHPAVCSRSPQEDATLFVGGLEADHAVARAESAPRADSGAACPWRRGARCAAGDGRPLACRLRAVEGAVPEPEGLQADGFARVRALELALRWPPSYGSLAEQVRSRSPAGKDPPPRASEGGRDPGPAESTD